MNFDGMTAEEIGKLDVEKLTRDEINLLVYHTDKTKLPQLFLIRVITRLERELAEREELIRLRQAVQYKPSSEQMELFFQEAEAIAEPEGVNADEQIIDVGPYRKKIRKQKVVASVPPSTPIYEIDHTQDAPDTIEKDGITYKRGEDRVVDKLAFIPAKVVVERHRYPSYVPLVAEEKPIVVYKSPLTDKLSSSPSLVAQIAVAKYDDQQPLFRQQEMFARDKIICSRQNMAIWLIKYNSALRPLERRFRWYIYHQCPLIYKDETPVQVLDLKGKSGRPSTNIFMHVTIGSFWDKEEKQFRRLVLYECKEGRSIKVVMEDIKAEKFNSYMATDGLKAYLHYSDEFHCGCWVHAERQCKRILKADKKNIAAGKICSMVSLLFSIEKEKRAKLVSGEIDEETFLAERKEESGKVIDEIYEYIAEIQREKKYAADSATMKAVKYIVDYKNILRNYLEVVEGEPSTNLVERAIRGFACGRKNWLFSKSVDGADASAFFTSLVESAHLAGLNSQDYLEYVCTFGPYCKTDEEWDSLLPWNADLSRLEELREVREKARPDKKRSEPYFLSGAV